MGLLTKRDMLCKLAAIKIIDDVEDGDVSRIEEDLKRLFTASACLLATEFMDTENPDELKELMGEVSEMVDTVEKQMVAERKARDVIEKAMEKANGSH